VHKLVPKIFSSVRRAPVNIPDKYLGLRVKKLELYDYLLVVRLEGGVQIQLRDVADYCCECRYMRTDDSLLDVEGGDLRGIELRDAAVRFDADGDPIEIQFLVVQTDQNSATIACMNSHNGHYSGMNLRLEILHTVLVGEQEIDFEYPDDDTSP